MLLPIISSYLSEPKYKHDELQILKYKAMSEYDIQA